MHVGLIAAVRFDEPSQRAIPTIGLYYLVSFTHKYGQGINVSVYKTPEDVIEAKPDIVGISTVTENMNIATEWAKKFKRELEVPIIIGGDHISALPHTLPDVFDVGVIGEGEETFLELTELIKSDKDWKNNLGKVKGLCFHGMEKVEITESRPLVTPIEKIPYPRRDKNVWGGFHYCFTSRGCPYHCTFCSPATIWKRYRAFPAEYVVGEIAEIFKHFNPYYIHFFDDLFIGDRERIRKLKRLFRRMGFHKRVPFGGHIRADLMDDSMCEDLRGMNFVSGSFGAESGSDKILKFLKTGTTTVKMNQKAMDMCYKWGIQMNISFIIGTPGETEEDIKKTIDFIEKNRKKLIGIEIFIVLPYPGTPLWTFAKRKGYVTDDMDWEKFRTKAWFSELEVDDDYLYINEDMEWNTFKKYIKIFQDIDRDLNKNNIGLYKNIEKSVKTS